MLIRQNYQDERRTQIKQLVLEILDDLIQMTVYYEAFLEDPTDENRDIVLKTENYVNKNEKRIERYILEVISLEQLNTDEIKWLFSINRMIRDLERIGDQLTNIIVLSDIVDINELRPMINDFFKYEQDMMRWLSEGIENKCIDKLEKVIAHDKHVNNLNKDTFKSLVNLIDENETLTESKLKTIIISRFLERIGDHLVNVAKTYKKVVSVD